MYPAKLEQPPKKENFKTMDPVETQKKKLEFAQDHGAASSKVPAAMEGFVETKDGVRLFYKIFGTQGPVLVLCDGIGCHGYIWKYLTQDLAQDYRIVQWHYRGHGNSTIPKKYRGLTIKQMAADLNRVIDEVIKEKVVLVGHSMGTQVILEFHRLYGSEKIRALIPMCGASGKSLDQFMHSNVMKTIFPFLYHSSRIIPVLPNLIWKGFFGNKLGYYGAIILRLVSTMVSKKDLQPYLDHIANMDERVFIELARDMGDHNAFSHLPNINVPTLVFAGMVDNFTPYHISAEMAEFIPNAQLCEVRGGTHTAPLEFPDLVNLRVRKFLKTI